MNSIELNIRGLKNPTKEDYTFKWDGSYITVRAGEIKQMPQYLAEHGARKLAMILIAEQYGFAKVIDEKLVSDKMDTLLSGGERSDQEPKEKGRIESEILTQDKEESKPVAKVEADGFENLNEDELLKEELKSNSPRAYQESKYNEMSFSELREIAKEQGIKVHQVKRDTIVKDLLDKEYGAE